MLFFPFWIGGSGNALQTLSFESYIPSLWE